MTRIRHLIFLSLALVVFGCSSGWKVTETDTLEEQVAILPVIPAHIIMPADSEEDYVKMAKRANSVLNKLAKRNKGKLLGPKKVRKLLDKSNLESLYLILDELGDHTKNPKSKKLAEISNRLEVRKFIRVKVQIMRPHAYEKERRPKGPFSEFKQCSGWVDVSADLFGISPPQQMATKTNHKESWGETGWSGGCVGPVPVMVPYDTYKRSEGRALGQAAHGAIAGVLNKLAGDGWTE